MYALTTVNFMFRYFQKCQPLNSSGLSSVPDTKTPLVTLLDFQQATHFMSKCDCFGFPLSIYILMKVPNESVRNNDSILPFVYREVESKLRRKFWPSICTSECLLNSSLPRFQPFDFDFCLTNCYFPLLLFRSIVETYYT